MEIKESTALVTGANRGIGYAVARALIARGPAKVYAGVRDPASVSGEYLTPLRLDVTVPEEVAAAASAAGDATIVIVHAGFAETDLSSFTGAPKISAEDVADQTTEALANDRVEVLPTSGPGRSSMRCRNRPNGEGKPPRHEGAVGSGSPPGSCRSSTQCRISPRHKLEKTAAQEDS
ncbi:hypothetical protein [Streptomyces sp. NPDC001851]|uniref:hypothetical protein n=1 Tax=Streptomyces sp. NPDC001851 TaxID=3154529 RepID=UPI00331715BE